MPRILMFLYQQESGQTTFFLRSGAIYWGYSFITYKNYTSIAYPHYFLNTLKSHQHFLHTQ